MVSELNVTTQEQITREMNDEEYAQWLLDKEATDILLAEEETKRLEKEAAKAAINSKLEALGLDLDTINAIASRLTDV